MHIPRKRFGQHFLEDGYIIQQIVDAINPHEGEHLVEIGPGQGALTIPVLRRAKALDVVELDRDLIPTLTHRTRDHGLLTIHQADALQFNFGALAEHPQSLRVIGNLPYNISTPLIFHLLDYAEVIQDMHFMLQKEVVDRLAADKGNADYGRLSVMVQYHCKVTSLFDVPPTAFYPPPKVDSSIVRIIPHRTLPHIAKDPRHFAALVKQAFSQRRKTLRNCLKSMVQDNDWIHLDMDSSLRAEQLSVADYVNLSNTLLDTPAR